MKVLYNQNTQRVIDYPRKDQQEIVGLSSEYLILEQVETVPPNITENQSLSSSYVVDVNNLEYRQEWEVLDNPVTLNWNGLYLTLMNSSVYADLVIVGQQLSGVDGALDKTIDAIQYGIFKPDSIAAFPAFQSAIDLLMYVLMSNQIALSNDQLQQVRNALDNNGFNNIQLGD